MVDARSWGLHGAREYGDVVEGMYPRSILGRVGSGAATSSCRGASG